MSQQQLLPQQTYLLRYWEETRTAAPTSLWRFSLEDPASGQRREFATLRELVIALHTELVERRYLRQAAARRRAVPLK